MKTPPGFVRGPTQPGTEGNPFGKASVATLSSAVSTDLGSHAARAAVMDSQNEGFKWEALPQRKPRKTRKRNFKAVPWNYQSSKSKSRATKKQGKSRASKKSRIAKSKHNLEDLLNRMSLDPNPPPQLDDLMKGLAISKKVHGSRK